MYRCLQLAADTLQYSTRDLEAYLAIHIAAGLYHIILGQYGILRNKNSKSNFSSKIDARGPRCIRVLKSHLSVQG